MTPDNLRATDTASTRDELRWALVQEFQQARGGFAQTEDDVAHADALLAGLVGDLLAEVERLREHSPSPEVLALIERSSLGTEEAKAARASVSPDAGRLLVRLSHVMADRERLRAQVEAVRELADNARRNSGGGPYTAQVDVLSLRRILDATDGGDRDE